MADMEEPSQEDIEEKDTFVREEVEDVEGRIKDFFMGLFGRKKEDEPIDEDVGNYNIVDEEDDFVEDDLVDGNAFVRDSKLYGQDYEKLQVWQNTKNSIHRSYRKYEFIKEHNQKLILPHHMS